MSKLYEFCLLCGAEASIDCYNLMKGTILSDKQFHIDLQAELYANYHLDHLVSEKKYFS